MQIPLLEIGNFRKLYANAYMQALHTPAMKTSARLPSSLVHAERRFSPFGGSWRAVVQNGKWDLGGRTNSAS